MYNEGIAKDGCLQNVYLHSRTRTDKLVKVGMNRFLNTKKQL
jgi:hypothetical protein